MTVRHKGGDSSDGFTLIELIVVLGLISILLGLGIGFLNEGGNDSRLAWSTLRDQLRLVGETARNQGRPTELRMRQAPGSPVELRARVLRDVGQWHLEENERYFNRLTPDLSGVAEPRGRYGYGMRPDPESQSPMFAVDVGHRSAIDLELGFICRLEVLLEQRERCTIVEFGQGFRFGLDAEGKPEARLTLRGSGNKAGLRVDLLGDKALPLNRWFSIELFHDGRHASLLVDGVTVARRAADGEVLQNKADRFQVSPANAPVPGVLDEIGLACYEESEPRRLPLSVTMKGLPMTIRFDRRGELVPPARPGMLLQLELDETIEKRSLAPGGLLQ